jgi:hypothetical protein
MTDILHKIQTERSAACLMSLRSWAIDQQRWGPGAQEAYDTKFMVLSARWK